MSRSRRRPLPRHDDARMSCVSTEDGSHASQPVQPSPPSPRPALDARRVRLVHHGESRRYGGRRFGDGAVRRGRAWRLLGGLVFRECPSGRFERGVEQLGWIARDIQRLERFGRPGLRIELGLELGGPGGRRYGMSCAQGRGRGLPALAHAESREHEAPQRVQLRRPRRRHGPRQGDRARMAESRPILAGLCVGGRQVVLRGPDSRRIDLALAHPDRALYSPRRDPHDGRRDGHDVLQRPPGAAATHGPRRPGSSRRRSRPSRRMPGW